MLGFARVRDVLLGSWSVQEWKLLTNVCKKVSFYFFVFAFFVCGLSSITFKLFKNTDLASSLLCIVGAIGLFSLFLFRIRRYSRSPLAVSDSYVSGSFFLLFVSYACFFVGLILTLLQHFASKNTSDVDSNLWMFITVLGTFGVSFLIYLIPAAIGFYISKRSTAISINKFIFYCSIAYLVMAVVLIFGFVYAISSKSIPSVFNPVFMGAFFLLYWIINLGSIIVSIYRMKETVKYINYEDDVEVKKWEKYFIFENILMLLHLALRLLSKVIFFITSRK